MSQILVFQGRIKDKADLALIGRSCLKIKTDSIVRIRIIIEENHTAMTTTMLGFRKIV